MRRLAPNADTRFADELAAEATGKPDAAPMCLVRGEKAGDACGPAIFAPPLSSIQSGVSSLL
jgi:hypothetical protein